MARAARTVRSCLRDTDEERVHPASAYACFAPVLTLSEGAHHPHMAARAVYASPTAAFSRRQTLLGHSNAAAGRETRGSPRQPGGQRLGSSAEFGIR
jgi:hypothetical protein